MAYGSWSSPSSWNSRSGLPTNHSMISQHWSSPGSSHTADMQTALHDMRHTNFDAGFSVAGSEQNPFSPAGLSDVHAVPISRNYAPLPRPIERPPPISRTGSAASIATASSPPFRRTSGKDEADGPYHFLPKPDDAYVDVSEDQLPQLPTSLQAEEQDAIRAQMNDCLSKCAFDFIAKYQFPLPLEADKLPVRRPQDLDWMEWSHVIKRLATKRRIPTRVLWYGQIKLLITVLDSSVEARSGGRSPPRPLKDDRHVLQLVSAGLQVAKMLKDPQAMAFLDQLYSQVESSIRNRS